MHQEQNTWCVVHTRIWCTGRCTDLSIVSTAVCFPELRERVVVVLEAAKCDIKNDTYGIIHVWCRRF